MSKKDYERFLYKIDQLNQLVRLINSSPEKYKINWLSVKKKHFDKTFFQKLIIK